MGGKRGDEVAHEAGDGAPEGVRIVLGASILVRRFSTPEQPVPRRVLTVLMLLILVLFVALKTEPLATEISRAWRAGTGQDTALATFIDLNWLGFSYVAFRLIHTLRGTGYVLREGTPCP